MSDERPVPWRGDSFGRALAAYDLDNLRQKKRLILFRILMTDEYAEDQRVAKEKHGG